MEGNGQGQYGERGVHALDNDCPRASCKVNTSLVPRPVSGNETR